MTFCLSCLLLLPTLAECDTTYSLYDVLSRASRWSSAMRGWFQLYYYYTEFNVPLCRPQVTNRRHRCTVTWSEVERVVVGFKCKLNTSQWIEIVSYVGRQRVPHWRSNIAKSSIGENSTGTICVQLTVLTWWSWTNSGLLCIILYSFLVRRSPWRCLTFLRWFTSHLALSVVVAFSPHCVLHYSIIVFRLFQGRF